jgi:hypothetical protein
MSSPVPPPPLDVRFGSSLHTVYSASDVHPLPSSAIVVAPSLLGSERNVTHYHEIRHDLEQFVREDRKDADWSFDRNVRRHGVVTLPGRELRCRAAAVNDAVRRICQYFSMRQDAVGVGVLYRRGCPQMQYRSDEVYVQPIRFTNVGGLSTRQPLQLTPSRVFYP